MIDATTKHPSYARAAAAWRIARACYDGELAVRAATTEFLPMTEGEIEDGAAPQLRGWKRYRARPCARRSPISSPGQLVR